MRQLAARGLPGVPSERPALARLTPRRARWHGRPHPVALVMPPSFIAPGISRAGRYQGTAATAIVASPAHAAPRLPLISSPAGPTPPDPTIHRQDGCRSCARPCTARPYDPCQPSDAREGVINSEFKHSLVSDGIAVRAKVIRYTNNKDPRQQHRTRTAESAGPHPRAGAVIGNTAAAPPPERMRCCTQGTCVAA